MIEYLPARVDRATDESLDSWLDRLATANSLPVRNLLPPELSNAQLARLLGLSIAELNRMTVFGYHRSVVGRPRQRILTWRADQHHWICPRCCVVPSSPRLLQWQLALHPVCLSCACFLVRARDTDARVLRAHPKMLDLVGVLMRLTETAWINKHHAARLRRLRRITNLVAHSLDAGWPPRPFLVPEIAPASARQWGRHPASDPLVAATLLAVTGQLGTSQLDRLIDQGWQRIGRHPGVPISWLPKRPATVPSPPSRRHPSELGRTRLKTLRAELQLLQHVSGLKAEHVPATLFVGTEYPLPNHHEWGYREIGAIALVMLLSDLDAIRASQYLHVPYEASPAFDDLTRNHTIRPDHAAMLRQGGHTLIREGLIDYQQRRRTLTAHWRLPSQLVSRLRLPRLADPTLSSERRALAWMWVILTRSTLTSSPWPMHDTQAALDFGQHVLDPEQRLLLLEYGNQLLTLTEHDIAHDRPTPSGHPDRQAQ